MGNSLLCMVKSYFGYYPQMRLLMMGLDAAGKTTILYKLKLNQQVDTIPTIGFNVEEINHGNLNLTIWDIGWGGGKLYPLWYHYLELGNAHQAVIYVVDSTDRERITESADILHFVLSQEVMKQNLKLLLVLANKQDRPESMTVPEVRDKMKLETIKPEINWDIMGCSATIGDGLYEALDWIVLMYSRQREEK